MAAPKFKRSQSDIKKFLQYGEFGDQDNPIDEASLTDNELQDRLSAFQELGQTPGEIDSAGAQRELQNQLDAFGVRIGPRSNIENVLSGFLSKAQRLPDIGEFRDELNSVSGGEGQRMLGYNPLINFLNDQNNKNHFAQFASGQIGSPKVGGDVKRIQDLMGERSRKAEEQGALDKFVSDIPGQLDTNTEEFFAGKREQGKRTLEDFLNPQIRDQLAARGLLTSGDLDAELANAAGEISSPIEQGYVQSKADDLAFFENAAYQTNLKKTIDANQDLASRVNFERANALNAQSNRFQQGQQSIADSSSLALFRRQQQSNMQAQQERLRRQSDMQKAQSQSGMMGGIGQSVGAIGGAVIGNMIAPGVGGMVGAGIGGQFGGGAANLFSKTG